ncbi:MAG: hypothetical protein KAU90_07710 [Sulfurovaceae bacterium]|nr:hypothetical protein [Sulfurovaceae bacterium]
MLKHINLILLSMVTISSIQAKDYQADKNGNVNVNIVDRKVIVGNKVVRTIPKGEAIKADVGRSSASIDKDKLKANVGKDIGAKIDGENISANVGGISAKINGENISVNIGSILTNALKNRNSKDDKEHKNNKDDDFFHGDPFFSK